MKKSLINTKMLIGISVALIMSSAGLMVHGQVGQTCFSCPKGSVIADTPYTSDTCPANCQWDSTMNGGKGACCAGEGYGFDKKCGGRPPINSFSYVGNGEGSWWHEPELDGKSDVPSSLTNSSCIYGCKEGYYSYLGSCKSSACKGEAIANSVVVRGSINPNNKPKIYDTFHYVSDPNSEEGCSYTCKSGYEWDGEKCEKIETQPQKWFYQFMNIDKLTIGIWNSIMEKLDEILTRSDDGVPSGAIMAFALNECPSGWRRFGEADGRFLRGSGAYNGGVGIGGSGQVKLSANNLPSHRHYVAGNFEGSSNAWTKDNKNGTIISYSKTPYKDDNDWYALRTTALSEANEGLTSTVGQGTPFNIMNPYLDILYCVKQ